jgi:hypothetical protein
VIVKQSIALLVLLAFAPSLVDCVFVRNGKEYDAQDAEAHLRMKYRRGKRYAPTTEKFIERLASMSSMSKKPYFIECGDEQRVPSGQWLTNLLSQYRTGQ